MKIQDVPQDNDLFLAEGKVRDVCYAIDEQGKYTKVLSLGWRPKNEAMKQAWDEVHERAEEIKKDVGLGKVSPIAYYMEKTMMDIKILSQYTGFAKRKIKKHLDPGTFKTLDRLTLEKYAAVFQLTVEELTDIELLKKNDTGHED